MAFWAKKGKLANPFSQHSRKQTGRLRRPGFKVKTVSYTHLDVYKRQEWEELPSSLVDWKATEQYEKDRASAPAIPEAALIDKETEADREASRLPEVAPGLHLPEASGMFLLCLLYTSRCV